MAGVVVVAVEIADHLAVVVDVSTVALTDQDFTQLAAQVETESVHCSVFDFHLLTADEIQPCMRKHFYKLLEIADVELVDANEFVELEHIILIFT